LAVTWREWLKPAVWYRVIAGFLPTAAIGFVLYHFVKTFLSAHPITIALALIVGGIVLVAFEQWLTKRPLPTESKQGIGSVEGLSYKQAVTIGLGQSLAVIPGVSRSAATIVTGLALGIPRTTIVAYSFLLAVPTIGAAAVYDLYKQRALLTADHLDLLAVGFVVSAVVAFLSVRWLLGYIRKHDFTWFGIYRIVFGALFALWLLL
jgi:undecaprenyl-diphosphatase